MKTIKKQLTISTLAALVLAAFLPSTASADRPGEHPAYLNALEDLRHARACLAPRTGDREVKWDTKTAIKEIDVAIAEIKKAAIDVGKDIYAHPPIDAKLDSRARLTQALQLLRKAEKNVQQKEDDKSARGLQQRALQHINAAIRLTEEGIGDVRRR